MSFRIPVAVVLFSFLGLTTSLHAGTVTYEFTGRFTEWYDVTLGTSQAYKYDVDLPFTGHWTYRTPVQDGVPGVGFPGTVYAFVGPGVNSPFQWSFEFEGMEVVQEASPWLAHAEYVGVSNDWSPQASTPTSDKIEISSRDQYAASFGIAFGGISPLTDEEFPTAEDFAHSWMIGVVLYPDGVRDDYYRGRLDSFALAGTESVPLPAAAGAGLGIFAVLLVIRRRRSLRGML